MASPIFNITALDIRKKLNPTNEPNLFQYGDDNEITESDVDEVILDFEDYVASRIPEYYRRMLRHVDGEILTDYAKDQDSTFTLGLIPFSNLQLYLDFFTPGTIDRIDYPDMRSDGDRPWSDRNASDVLTASAYTVATDTGVITMASPLSEGQRLYAEYDHTASQKCRVLRKSVINLAATEWARRVAYISPDEFEMYAAWEAQGYSDLKRMESLVDGRLGLDVFDQLKLVKETRGISSVQDEPALGGW